MKSFSDQHLDMFSSSTLAVMLEEYLEEITCNNFDETASFREIKHQFYNLIRAARDLADEAHLQTVQRKGEDFGTVPELPIYKQIDKQNVKP